MRERASPISEVGSTIMDFENDKLLKIKDVSRATGLAISTIYKKISEGEFPKPIHLGTRTVRWWQSAIAQWLDSKPGGRPAEIVPALTLDAPEASYHREALRPREPEIITVSKDTILSLDCCLLRISGVYFLIADDEIVYVGESENIIVRISQHIQSDKGKIFDRWCWLQVPAEERRKVERAYITRFNPRLNRAGVAKQVVQDAASKPMFGPGIIPGTMSGLRPKLTIKC